MSAVRDSFNRINNIAFSDRFYGRLLATDPKIEEMFQHTDFKQQKEALLGGIYVLLECSEGTAIGKLSIKRLREKHNRNNMNVAADLYPVWVDCFIETLAEMDPLFSPELGAEWREALQPGIDIMIAGY